MTLGIRRIRQVLTNHPTCSILSKSGRSRSTNPSNPMSQRLIRPTNLRYKLIQSNLGQRNWSFTIQSRNGNVIAKSGPYRRRANALKTLLLLAPPNPKVEIAA